MVKVKPRTILWDDPAVSEENLRRLRKFRLLDDTFARVAFKGNIPDIQFLLETILDRKVPIKSVATQVDYPHPIYRSVVMDVIAVDNAGNIYNIEFQRNGDDDVLSRARFHQGMLDCSMVPKGGKFKDMRESYVIFILEQDLLHQKVPVHPTCDIVDGRHTLYLNCAYDDLSTPIGQLIHDLKCSEPDEMVTQLHGIVRQCKETKKGVENMCRIMDEYKQEITERVTKETTERVAKETAKEMLADGMPVEKIAKYTDLSVEEIESLRG